MVTMMKVKGSSRRMMKVRGSLRTMMKVKSSSVMMVMKIKTQLPSRDEDQGPFHGEDDEGRGFLKDRDEGQKVFEALP